MSSGRRRNRLKPVFDQSFTERMLARTPTDQKAPIGMSGHEAKPRRASNRYSMTDLN
jgi:hypothetical protein